MSTRRAFTLIELLVVVAIIVALLAILLPSMGKAIALAERAVCQSNLHQQGIAMMSYNADSFLLFPGAHSSAGDMVWMPRLRRYAGDAEAVFNCPTADPDYHWTQRFGSGQPAAFGWENDEVRIGQFGVNSRFTYGYNDCGTNEPWWSGNAMLGLGNWVDGGFGDPAWARHVGMTEVRSPSNMIALGDSNPDEFFDAIIDPNDTFTQPDGGEHPSRRHDEGSNVVFVDGHAEWDTQDNLRVRPGEPGAIERARRWNNDQRAHDTQWFPQHAG